MVVGSLYKNINLDIFLKNNLTLANNWKGLVFLMLYIHKFLQG